MTQKSLLELALELSPTERAALAQELLASLDESDFEIDELWKKEAERRYSDYKAGKAKTVSLADVLAKYK